MKEWIDDKEALKKILSENKFMGFDTFLIREMGYELFEKSENQEKIRREAFHTFRKRTDKYPFASLPTMRKWFGIGGNSVPSREVVYRMCFQMRLGKEKVEEYLKIGLGEPSFFINDYYEMIFLYGFENGLDFKRCMAMAQVFEENLEQEIHFSKTHTTNELIRQYEDAKMLDEQQFVIWMSDRADWFRGYSKTSLDYLVSLKKAVLNSVKKESEKELKRYLSEFDYDRWAESRKSRLSVKFHDLLGHEGEDVKDVRRSEQKEILAFLKRGRSVHGAIPEEELEILKELYHLAYDEKDVNSRLLAEIPMMTDKHLSDLLNVAIKKEQRIRMAQAIRVLSRCSEKELCPEYIQKLVEECTKGKNKCEYAGEALQIFNALQKENKRRCLLVQRDDILPMILYLAQQRYREEYEFEYNQANARSFFIDMANAALNTCNMPVISENFRLDSILLHCFLPEEMLSYAELVELLNEL